MKTDVTAIPEERVATILARAAELDRDSRETITVDAIRNAALDAGISTAAVDAALAEYVAGEVPEARPEKERGSRFDRVRSFFRRKAGRTASALKRPLKLAAFMFILGLTGAAGEGGVILAIAGWLFLVGRLIFRHRPSRRIAPYAVGLIVMTIGGLLGFAAAEVDEDPIAVMATLGVILLVVGSAVVKLRLPRRWRRGVELEQLAG